MAPTFILFFSDKTACSDSDCQRLVYRSWDKYAVSSQRRWTLYHQGSRIPPPALWMVPPPPAGRIGSLRFAGAAAIYFRFRYGYAVQNSKACIRKLSTRGHHDLIDRPPQLEASLRLSTHALRVEHVTDLSCYYLCRNMYTVYSHQPLSHVSSVASPGHNHTSQEDSSKVQTLQKTRCTVQGE